MHDEHLNAIKENERIPLLEEELENSKLSIVSTVYHSCSEHPKLMKQ